MALVQKIEFGSEGWNTIYYTDGTKYIGYTLNNETREGLGTLYTADGSILKRGKWQDDEFIESLEENEYNLQVNISIKHTPHW